MFFLFPSLCFSSRNTVRTVYKAKKWLRPLLGKILEEAPTVLLSSYLCTVDKRKQAVPAIQNGERLREGEREREGEGERERGGEGERERERKRKVLIRKGEDLSQMRRQLTRRGPLRPGTTTTFFSAWSFPGVPVGPPPPGTVSGWFAVPGPSNINSNSGTFSFRWYCCVSTSLCQRRRY